MTELGKRLANENPCPEPDLTVIEARALVKRYITTAGNNPVPFYHFDFRKGYGGNQVHSFTLLRLIEFGAVTQAEHNHMMFTPKGIEFLIRTANR